MIRSNDSKCKTTLKAAVLLSALLLFAAVAAFGQQQINLTAGPTTLALPDGSVVPMWGYSCGAAVTGSTATCAALNPNFLPATTTTPAGWSPVVITVPTGAAGGLQINLTNNLSFTPTGATTANTIPTSIVIVGQVGGGLGTARTSTPPPNHTDAQGCVTWFIANTPPGQPCTPTTPIANPPAQGNRVQSMATEVAAGATTSLTWSTLKPGTYLLESGTHPSIQVPMGLIGVLVVTTAPTPASGTTAAAAGTAYPGLPCTPATGATTCNTSVPAVQYNAEIPLEFSEIDPVQNKAVNAAVNTAGFSETRVWSGMVGGCGNPNSPVGVVNTCYPPAVNYTPFYFLINGVPFNKTIPGNSLFAAVPGTSTAQVTGTVLVRLVNAGLRMHVPSIVNSLTNGFTGGGVLTTAANPVGGFTLIAEDGNPLPGVQAAGAPTAPAAPRVQTDVFMAAGKTYDVMINVPVAGTPALPIYDRELSLSGNSSVRDAGMVAYIGINGSALSVPAGTGVFAKAQANPDTYDSLVAGQTLAVSDPSKGVIANDVNVYGVQLLTAPGSGTLTCDAQPQNSVPGICANGTFTYHPTGTATSDAFTYCANGTVSGTTCSSGLTATVTLGPSGLTGGTVTANGITYTSRMATFLKIPSPGVLAVDSDSNGLPLQVVTSSVTPSGVTINMDPNGGFTATAPAAGTYTFTYKAQNSLGTQSSAATVTLIFPAPSNLAVTVLDGADHTTQISDYRWIIEEDKTFWVDPNCTTNSSTTTAGCPGVVPGPAGTTTVQTLGVNFHTSSMDFVAQGCTGPLSCEGGQTMLDTRPACTGTNAAVCSATAGQHIPAVCDLGNGACRPDPNCTALPCLTSGGFTAVLPSSVHLDPTKRYYISVLPGDAANPFPSNTSAPSGCAQGAIVGGALNTGCGHTMSGAPVPPACNVLTAGCTPTSTATFAPVTVLANPTPLPTGKLSVMVFEDDFPLNGEQDAGGGIDVLSPNEPGLGGFSIVLWDTYGGLGDVTGQDTYDMFNQPLSNSLAGTIDPATGLDACPVSPQITANAISAAPGDCSKNPLAQGCQKGITGMIVTCPKYESDGSTLSPLAGQAVIANLMPEKFSVQAYPGADRIARGEEWLQTNTLDGQHPHDSFIRIGEPGYFQEYGPAGYHVSIGFANPAIINARHAAVCAGSFGAVSACTGTIQGQVDLQRLSRTPDQRLYPSGSRDALTWSQCWVSLGDPDAEDFMFTKCDANGNFKFTNVPDGSWRLTIGDQWNDQIIDGLSTPANVAPGQTLNLGQIGVQQWQSNLYTVTFIDDNKNGIKDPGEIGIPFLYNMIHYRDGHNSNALVTDFNGVANFNETFPLFNWYVFSADDSSTSTRYKTTGIHTVYDAGGPADGTSYCGTSSNGARQCGTSGAYNFLANTFEGVPLPADLSVPGAVYCAKADCSAEAASFAAGTAIASSSTASTGRIDPPWVWAEGWSGLTAGSNYIEVGKAPFAACPPACATVPISVLNSTGGTTASTTQVGENGGIQGVVDYASTRPFDNADQMIEQPWESFVPNVTMNLYQEGFASDGVTPTLTLVDTTQTSSWDNWAQGFYPTGTAGSGSTAGQKPYMSCPGQGTSTGTNADLFFFSLNDQPNYLDWYNSVHNGGTLHTLPYNSQFKCYDAMHIGNQVQPAVFDGKYSFPSSLGIDPSSGKQLAVKGSTNGVPSSMNGTNCTICVPNPDTTDVYRVGNPMLPPGKYVVEVIMPPGYEVYKEEDKNLLIGDNYIAPVTNQFAGLGGNIFIMPDQASVASLYDPSGAGFNPTNFQNETTGTGTTPELSGVPGFPGFQNPVWPCVGEQRVVPDYLSLFPQALETAPFAGATRPLCDRKEVTLSSQTAVQARFFIYTSTHIASKFTGVITDDFTSEFDPFAPQFGEKFAPPNMPISTRDYLGNEISRVYSDHWGIYDGLTYSSWEVNPPNITGYSPTMMVQCMNDAGPIKGANGQMINDPLYNPAYSNFCYEEPYMPGLTTYLDTPVVPTQAFVGAGYNNPDCSYPDATPAISEVDGDGVGPWVSAAGHTLTITALGDQQVTNFGYSGPSASAPPFNAKTVGRHYGFGNNATVTIGGVPQTCSGSDLSLTCTVSLTGTVNGKTVKVPDCQIQQQAQYGGKHASCGELVITTANTAPAGQPSNSVSSIDAVTVTIGGKAPDHVPASDTIQSHIDKAAPGDLIIVDPTCSTTTGVVACTTAGATTNTTASHTEMLIMWKPVRLQGVGAASTIINANTHPAGKLLDPWRRHINCLFGLTLQGVPYAAAGSGNNFDPSGASTCPDAGWKYFQAQPNNPQIDRLPLEATVGWDATLNGNLAELLQEPSLMGAYEGAGITVLAKGVEFHGRNPWSDGTEQGAFPPQATLLTGVVSDPGSLDGDEGGLQTGDANNLCHTVSYSSAGAATITSQTNPYPSNFICNPSSIDGLTITNSSQGGGGIFVHGWAHFIEIANNRVYNNAGTLSGGISVGQGEFAPPYLQGGATNAAPGSCSDGTGFVTNQHLPMCLQLHPNVHHNMITNNSSIGDELFSATLSGGGGATFCTGNDYYKFNFNWICGNLSAGEGGGMVHLGEIQNSNIEHNAFVFNQSSNPTIPTNGGGIMVMGTPDTDPVCTSIPDADCPPGLSDGTGHHLLINGNLIQGNMAESGSGGGIRLQQVNGTDVSTFAAQPELWNDVRIENNIIVNNEAGWDGAGISLQDSLNVRIRNNTIVHNDTLASSGVLITSLGAPQASAPAGNCTMPGPTGADTASCPQSAGLTSTPNSSLLTATFTGLTIECPDGAPGCKGFSNPILTNNVFWQNRSFHLGVGARGTGGLNQQNLVSLFNAFSNAPAPTQTITGDCSGGGSYWDIGVRGDRTVAGHESGFTLRPRWSVLTDASDYPGGFNLGSDPTVVSQYCNGSRVPPECTSANGCGGPNGFGVPPGIADAVAPNPLFSLVPSATVDEGNNWINVSWGPLSLTNPSVTGGPKGNYGGGAPLGNYALTAASPAVDYIPSTIGHPSTDFFGNPRPDPARPNCFDVGAVEFPGLPASANGCSAPTPTLAAIAPSSGIRGTSFTVTLTGNNLANPSSVAAGPGITVTNVVPAPGNPTTVTATFTINGFAALATRDVTFRGANGNSTLPGAFTVVAPTVTAIGPISALRGSTNLQVDIYGTGLSGATNVTMGGGGGITLVPGSITVTPDGTHLTGQVNVSNTANLGASNVRVQTAGGLTAANPSVTFTVLGPTVTGITPTTGTHGTSVNVTITGTGLTGATAVTAGGGSITTSNIVVSPDGATLTATFTIANGAARTVRNVRVTTPIGVTPANTAVTFTVQ